MIEEIIGFYRTHLTFYSLVAKKRWRWQTVSVFILLVAIVVLTSKYITTYQISYIIWSVSLFLVALLLILIFNSLTVKRLYPRFYLSLFKWDKRAFHKEMVLKLKQQLKTMNLDEEKIAKLQTTIINKAEREKVSSIVFMSCIAALFVPLWSAYLSQLMSLFKEVKDLNSVFIFLLMLVIQIAWLMVYLSDFRDSFLTRYLVLNRLNDMITDATLVTDCNEQEN
jgi:hypothetical protein